MFRLFPLIVVSIALVPLRSAAAFGSQNGTCATATVLGVGHHTGFQVSDAWVFVPFDPNGTYVSDEDWYRLTVPPGRSWTVLANPTQVFGTSLSSYWFLSGRMESDPVTCAGPLVPDVAFVNHTASAKDFLFRVGATALLSQSNIYVDYDVDVQDAPAPPLAPQPYCPAAHNSLNLSGGLYAYGSTSIAANALQFEGGNLIPNSFALLACGTSSTNVPFGDGRLCIAGAISRLHVGPTSVSGVWSAPLDIQGLPPSAPVSVGSRLYFQLYYRDASGPLGTGFNLTNGLIVTFAP